jgi:hypothetical protein
MELSHVGMSKIPYLVGLSLLIVSNTMAQPVLVTEHDWTFRVGTGRYGVCQWNLAPDDLNRHTTIYCGGPVLTLKIRAGNLAAMVLVPLAVVGIFTLSRCLKKNTNDHAA